MAELTALRRNIQIEEARFRFAVSESWAQKLGGSINFINNYHHAVKEWNINGVYGAMSLPFLGIDGFHPVLYDLEILSIFMFCQTAGSEAQPRSTSKRARRLADPSRPSSAPRRRSPARRGRTPGSRRAAQAQA
jgi:hypothetical protein